MSAFFEKHRDTLDKALTAARERGYWTPYPEMPSGKVYGETAKADGEAAFQALLNQPFDLDQPTNGQRLGSEWSPYGFDLGITYPAAGTDQLIAAAQAAGADWAAASPNERAGVLLEALHRLNAASFLMANAVMHTTGQAFVMAFQAGGAHAQDRGLEAVAYAYDEMSRVPAETIWEKPQGKGESVRLRKTFRVVPRGIAVLVACSTFPTWNGYPGLFASLATGNTVIVKPHPGAVLPLAISIRTVRTVLSEAGFDPNVVMLAVDSADAPITKELVTRPEVGIIDYTGGPGFGTWVEENAKGKQVYTEKAGVNSIVVHSTDNLKGMCQNIAFSLCLYSGQMCTAPQDIWVPRDGIETDQGHKTFEEVGAGIALAVDKLTGDPERASGILGAIQNPATHERVQKVADASGDAIIRPSTPYDHPQHPGARTATPLIVRADAGTGGLYGDETFGPISFVIATDTIGQAIERAADLAAEKGAITAGIYSTDDAVLAQAEAAFARAGASLSCNLIGPVILNVSAAFSDYHVSGANPAGNACLTDAAFVAGRFRVAATRRPAAA